MALLTIVVGIAYGQSEKHVLFIGNSYTEVNNLPSMVSNIANSLGDDLVWESNTPGGCTLRQHCQNQSMSLIRRGGWDAVVLQEQSQYPAFPDSQVQSEVFPYAQELVENIYAASPCAEPMFYMTWGRKYGDEYNRPFFPPIGTYEGMDSLLALRYRMMADQNDASLCPVGKVWHYLRDNHPEIELYQSDNSHPSLAGTYAAACSFYTMLFLRNPEDIRYDATLDPDLAATVRTAVRTIVYDSLAKWQRPLPELEIVLADTLSYMSTSFTLITHRADSIHIDWGDGTDTLFVASDQQMLQHTYAAEGEYTISLKAMRHCMTTQQSTSFTAQQEPHTPESISTPPSNGNPAFTLAPCPAHQQVRITFYQAPTELELLDLKGHHLQYLPTPKGQCHNAPQTIMLDIRQLPAGIYLIRARNAAGATTRQLIVY